MKRTPKDIQEEKKIATSALSSISGIKNNIPAIQQHTINFKGRKSSAIAGPIIATLTKSGDVVGDPFGGNMSFGIAAGNAGLKFIGNEYDNYTFAADKALFSKCEINKVKELFRIVEENCRESIMQLYETTCCGYKNYISKLHYDPEGPEGLFSKPEYFCPTKHRDIQDNKTIVMSNTCPVCGEKRKIFETEDLEKIRSTEKLDTSRFPAHRLIENSRINITSKHGADYYNRNYTKRAQYSLLKIQDAINELPDSPERDVLEHALVASLTLARISQYGSGSEYIYQVMRKQAQEKNVWEVFCDKVDAFIRFKEYYNVLQISDVTDDKNQFSFNNLDYRDFLNKYENCFSLIYTDPPYTDQVPYFERSQLYRDWLHAFYDKNDEFILSEEMLSKEIVVSNAPSRANTKSGYIQYYNDIDRMFSYLYKALKPDGRLVMTLKLGSNKYLLTLAEYIKLARKNGFEYITKFGLDKDNPTLRKQAAWKNTASNEMIVFFTKLDPEDRYWFVGNVNMESVVEKFIYENINKSTSFSLPLSECRSRTQQFIYSKYDVKPSETTQHKINKIINNKFQVVDNSLVYIDSNKIYLSEDNDSDLFAKLYDTIPVVIQKFDTAEGFCKEDLYFELINKLFEGEGSVLEKIVDSSHENEIRVLLENYCTMDNKDKYYLKKYTSPTHDHIVDVSSMDGYDFEDLIKRLLMTKGYSNVDRIGGAGDRGVDIMAKKDGKGYIFQCKRWLGNVGGTPIQRLHSMRIQMSPTISYAYCITTSDYTADAKRESASTDVGIINGKQLMEELERYFPGEYYHAILSK